MNSSYFMSPEWRVRIEAMKSQLLYWRDQCKQQEKKENWKLSHNALIEIEKQYKRRTIFSTIPLC